MEMVQKTPLKYLFSVIYRGGATFFQNEEDVSVSNPQKSAYYDVQQDKVEQFWISNDGVGIGVNLDTGKFMAYGSYDSYSPVEFSLGESKGPRKLIFWRQHTYNFNVDLEEQSHIIKYIVGYQDADGIEHTICID